MKTIFELGQSVLSELESNGAIEIDRISGLRLWKYDQQSLEFAVKRGFERRGFQYPIQLEELHLVPSEISISWRLKDANENLSGGFHILNIFESATKVFSNIKGYDAVFDEREVSADTREQFRKARYIDYVESFGYAVLMKGDNNTWDLNSIYFMEEEALEFRKMDLDLGTYMETVLTLKGAAYWQYLFFNKEYLSQGFDSSYMEHICRWLIKLPELWPNHDYSKVVERFKFMAECQLSNLENVLSDTLKITMQKLEDLNL